MNRWIVCALLLSTGLALAQAPGQKPAFEVASIKPADPSPMGQMRVSMNVDAGMLRYTNVSLKQCIRVAYRVKDYQIEGPNWLDGEPRFNITAKLPAGASQDQVPEMLQALLEERFKLTLHRDTKEHAVYALVAAKGGPSLKPAEVPAGEGSGTGAGRGGRGMMMMEMGPEGVHLKASSTTVAGLGEAISRFADRPIIDMTGIQGQYDFDLVLSPETVRNTGGGMMRGPGGGEHQPAEVPADSGGSIYDAVQKYGLKLEPRKAPMEILMVDHVEKTPTEN
jgi:uncharacterized protein (TIGR03435 family)